MILYYIDNYKNIEEPTEPVTVPVRLKMLFDKYKKYKDGGKLRKLEKIHSTTIALYIEDGVEQSIEELSLRMCFDLDYPFEEVLSYLRKKLLEDNLFTIQKQYGGLAKCEYMYYRWVPGTREPLYTYFKKYFGLK